MSGAIHPSRQLVLEEVVRQPDNAGGFTEIWTALGTLWADIQAGYGREREITAATLSYVPYRIKVRAAPEGAPARPKPGQRFVEGPRVFKILAVADYGHDGRYVECFTKEEVSA